MKKSSAYQGLTAARTPGSRRIPRTPSTARQKNHSTITGPNSAPMPPVPRFCTMNRQKRIAAVSGTTQSRKTGVASSSPSTAREHRDGGGDDAVTVEEGRAEEAEHDQEEGSLGAPGADQSQQRQNPALAPVIGSHDLRDVLVGDYEVQRPENQRQDAQDVFPGGRDAVLGAEALLEGVQGAGADVTVDDTERREG